MARVKPDNFIFAPQGVTVFPPAIEILTAFQNGGSPALKKLLGAYTDKQMLEILQAALVEVLPKLATEPLELETHVLEQPSAPNINKEPEETIELSDVVVDPLLEDEPGQAPQPDQPVLEDLCQPSKPQRKKRVSRKLFDEKIKEFIQLIPDRQISLVEISDLFEISPSTTQSWARKCMRLCGIAAGGDSDTRTLTDHITRVGGADAFLALYADKLGIPTPASEPAPVSAAPASSEEPKEAVVVTPSAAPVAQTRPSKPARGKKALGQRQDPCGEETVMGIPRKLLCYLANSQWPTPAIAGFWKVKPELIHGYITYLGKRLKLKLPSNDKRARRIEVMRELERQGYIDSQSYRQIPWNYNSANPADSNNLPALPSLKQLEELLATANQPLKDDKLTRAAGDLARSMRGHGLKHLDRNR